MKYVFDENNENVTKWRIQQAFRYSHDWPTLIQNFLIDNELKK